MEKNGTVSGKAWYMRFSDFLKSKSGRNRHNSWMRILIPISALFIFTMLVLVERRGVQLTEAFFSKPKKIKELEYSDPVEDDKKCLLVTDESDLYIRKISDEMKIVLGDMEVGYTKCHAEDIKWNEISNYSTIVFSFEDWDKILGHEEELGKWIKNGGHFMNAMTPTQGDVFRKLSKVMGIESYTSYASVRGLKIQKGMIGIKEKNSFPFDIDSNDSMKISIDVDLSSKADCYVTSLDETVPILWTYNYGNGRVAFLNDTLSGKFQRAFYCLSYSLLDDISIYPVINASAYYLDDFPSPIPEGDSSYIMRDYGIDTAAFYKSVWWPQILDWEKRYKIKHTGVVIEHYTDDVTGEFPRNETTARFISFGTMLLNNHGEIGLHGYNHQPLCLKGKDDYMQYGAYQLWPSSKDMEKAVGELNSFVMNLFPEETPTVYVPPSNIMSESGKKALLKAAPNIRIIASTYLPSGDNEALVQEFTVENNGIIDTPRIASGCNIDEYQYLSTFAELNYHFVQSHFLHPDDVLDPDRGAELGWKNMVQNFEQYLKYVHNAAPNLREVTGSGIGMATDVYHHISVKREYEDGKLNVYLGGFSEEAWFIMRVNEGKLKKTTGCDVEELGDGLYLVHATKDHIVFDYE